MNDRQAVLTEAAHWVGAHAVQVYLAGLLVLLLFTVLAWRVLHRWLVPSQSSALPPVAFLLTRLAVGFAVVVTGAWAFAEIAEALGAGPALAEADQRLSSQIGIGTPRPVLQLFAHLTRLGDVWTLAVLCIVVALALIARRRHGLALAWVVAVAGNGVLNPTLKAVFARMRPEHEHGLIAASGYSFPSGHSSGSVVAYGMLAYVLMRLLPGRWHLPVLLGAAAIAFTVGCSRVFLQVHFASDVVAGFASGAAWLAVCVCSAELTLHYRQRSG